MRRSLLIRNVELMFPHYSGPASFQICIYRAIAERFRADHPSFRAAYWQIHAGTAPALVRLACFMPDTSGFTPSCHLFTRLAEVFTPNTGGFTPNRCFRAIHSLYRAATAKFHAVHPAAAQPWTKTQPPLTTTIQTLKKTANRQLLILCNMAPPAGFEPTLREPESRVLSIYTTGANKSHSEIQRLIYYSKKTCPLQEDFTI